MGIKTKKKFGQHFLKNEAILERIISSHSDRKNVIEIGPGMGALTKYLLPNVKNLLLVEVDNECVKYLNDNYKGLNLLSGDILKINLEKLFEDNFSIISNLPYNISSQVFFKILENKDKITEFTFLIQKEVARRICSGYGNKTYGILSVLIQTFYETEYIFEVGPNEFEPPPKVDSALIRGVRNSTQDIGVPFVYFKNVVKQAFQNRRKTLRNSLKHLNLPISIKSHEIFSKRAEQLDINDFIWLVNEIKGNKL